MTFKEESEIYQFGAVQYHYVIFLFRKGKRTKNLNYFTSQDKHGKYRGFPTDHNMQLL